MRRKQIEHESEYVTWEKKLNASQQEVYEVAKKQGYLKQKGNNTSTTRTAFYYWCETHVYPCIVVENHGLTSTINLSFPPGLELSDSTTEKLWKIIVRYADPFEDNRLHYVKHVPSDESDKVAREIFELITEAPVEADSNNTDNTDSIKDIFAKRFNYLNKKGGGNAVQSRNQDMVSLAKERANGYCELCGKQAPFKDRDGVPYLEVHHIQWVSRGGGDHIKNVAALCPNCHRKMHVLDLPDDRIRLSHKAKLPFIVE